jgi:hypothetical protein
MLTHEEFLKKERERLSHEALELFRTGVLTVKEVSVTLKIDLEDAGGILCDIFHDGKIECTALPSSRIKAQIWDEKTIHADSYFRITDYGKYVLEEKANPTNPSTPYSLFTPA